MDARIEAIDAGPLTSRRQAASGTRMPTNHTAHAA
jgi:hypothetical protein